MEPCCKTCSLAEILPDGYDQPMLVCKVSDIEVSAEFSCDEYLEVKG